MFTDIEIRQHNGLGYSPNPLAIEIANEINKSFKSYYADISNCRLEIYNPNASTPNPMIIEDYDIICYDTFYNSDTNENTLYIITYSGEEFELTEGVCSEL